MWVEEGKQPIRPKRLGQGMMVSDFVDEFNGLLKLTEEEFARGKLVYPNLKKQARVLSMEWRVKDIGIARNL